LSKNQNLNIIEYDKTFSNYIDNEKISNNVYYIIVDGMLPLEKIKKNNINLHNRIDLFKENLFKNEFLYLEKSLSSYNTTYLSLASIFYNNYPVTDKSLKYLNRDLFFPNFFIKNYNNISLVNFLANNNYNLYWIGNNFRPDVLAPQFSINRNKNIIFNNIYQNLPLIMLFFENSYFDGFIKKLFSFFRNNPNIFDNNDALSKLSSFINSNGFKPNSKSYFFVHHIYPHTPFILNEDCTYKDNIDKNFKTGYLDNYLCTLITINNLIELLTIKDPNSIVVLQADHGWGLDKINSQDSRFLQTKERLEIFNAIKIPKKYRKYVDKNLDNVNTSRLINSIILNIEPNLLKKKTYFGYYEFQNSKNYGSVKLYEE
tara:strand:- start:547 stop:1662 length:1116 start_codon:yes stop_codon:yes gene_type:complete